VESLLEKPPARTGKCSLTLSIDGRTYRLRPAKSLTRGGKTWRLTVAAGQPRAGLTYSVCTFSGKLDCTCPDSTRNFAACKHMLALRALGLVPASARPTGEVTWALLHPAPPRTARPSRRPADEPVAAVASPADPIPARARRLHAKTARETIAAAAAPSTVTIAPPASAGFAAGFRAAVAEHTARLATGGVS